MYDAQKLDALAQASGHAHDSGEALNQFVRCCYEDGWVLENLDWDGWEAQALALSTHQERLTNADADTLARLLTTHVRKDRYVEGHLASMAECRVLEAIGRRAAALASRLRHGTVTKPDGLTPQTAIPVSSTGAEYEWLRQHRSGFTLIAQQLESHACGPRDHMILRSRSGEEAHAFFDISMFFGVSKDARPTAPCPFCGKPLRTARAKQCRHCGRAWRGDSSDL